MADTLGSLTRHAGRGFCLLLVAALPVLAQQPREDPPPTSPQFMSRFDFYMSAAALSHEDRRFKWDTHWAGDFDLVDYVHGRMTFVADYQALLGNEFRPFDPYQSNYTLEAAGSVRLKGTEIFAVLNHISRHLGDRPKRIAVAENSLGPRVLRRFRGGERTTFDLRADWRKVIARAYDDYTWMGGADLTIRHGVHPHAALYGRAFGETRLVDKTIAGRDRQDGGRVEAGVRVTGSAAAMDFFAGYERMIDADPLDRTPRRWAFAGFRLVGG
jgi:hypothetical protein